jgi:hypothetical protein
MVTVCAVVYVPVPGEITGVAAGGRLMVYVPLATLLLKNPFAAAIAIIVCVAFTGMADVYGVELVVGVVPFVV